MLFVDLKANIIFSINFEVTSL